VLQIPQLGYVCNLCNITQNDHDLQTEVHAKRSLVFLPFEEQWNCTCLSNLHIMALKNFVD